MDDVNHGWDRVGWNDWHDVATVRARLDAGADPDRGDCFLWRHPLHAAAENGSADVVAELARRVSEVDALDEGRSALWLAVYERRTDNVTALLAAGADPRLPMMASWSPGRLALAGPDQALFAGLDGAPSLTPTQAAAAAEASRLTEVLAGLHTEGTGLACVADLGAQDAIRRLEGVPAQSPWSPDDPWGDFADEEFPDQEDAVPQDTDLLVGVTDVPGGCVITQPWGFLPSTPGVLERLSAGTRCYGLYQNPKSGSQGSIIVDGTVHGWDLHPGGPPTADDPTDLVLMSYLHRINAIGYACAYAGLRLTDARAVTGPADHWVRLPERDYWI